MAFTQNSILLLIASQQWTSDRSKFIRKQWQYGHQIFLNTDTNLVTFEHNFNIHVCSLYLWFSEKLQNTTQVKYCEMRRVAKCQFFYTEQNPWIKFSPRTACKLQQFWYQRKAKLTTKRILLKNKCWQLHQIKQVYTQKSYISCANLPKIGLIWPNCNFSQTFYPNPQIFLHGYIRHIHDILQIWRG